MLVFCIAAIAIIFGSLTISQLASRSSQSGGLIAYAEENYNKSLACAFGWFQTFLYFPTSLAIVPWVAGIFALILGLGDWNQQQTALLLGMIFIHLHFFEEFGLPGGFAWGGIKLMYCVHMDCFQLLDGISRSDI